jgi:hypothetical protein
MYIVRPSFAIIGYAVGRVCVVDGVSERVGVQPEEDRGTAYCILTMAGGGMCICTYI